MDDLMLMYEPKATATYQGFVVGKVKSVSDPLCLGRVQVAVMQLDEEDTLPWARVVVPMADRTSGHYFIPRVDSTVLVGFENGESNAPYVIGCVWDLQTPPPQLSPTPETFCMRTPAGNQIVMAEKPATITLQTATGSSTPMPMPATSSANYSTLALTTNDIHALAPKEIKLEVAGVASLTIGPTSIQLKIGASSIEIGAAGIDIKSPRISINGTGTTSIKGGIVNIN